MINLIFNILFFTYPIIYSKRITSNNINRSRRKEYIKKIYDLVIEISPNCIIQNEEIREFYIDSNLSNFKSIDS